MIGLRHEITHTFWFPFTYSSSSFTFFQHFSFLWLSLNRWIEMNFVCLWWLFNSLQQQNKVQFISLCIFRIYYLAVFRIFVLEKLFFSLCCVHFSIWLFTFFFRFVVVWWDLLCSIFSLARLGTISVFRTFRFHCLSFSLIFFFFSLFLYLFASLLILLTFFCSHFFFGKNWMKRKFALNLSTTTTNDNISFSEGCDDPHAKANIL